MEEVADLDLKEELDSVYTMLEKGEEHGKPGPPSINCEGDNCDLEWLEEEVKFAISKDQGERKERMRLDGNRTNDYGNERESSDLKLIAASVVVSILVTSAIFTFVISYMRKQGSLTQRSREP